MTASRGADALLSRMLYPVELATQAEIIARSVSVKPNKFWRAAATARTAPAGIALAVTLTGGNRNDVTQFVPLLKAVPKVRGRRARPRRRPLAVYVDRGYDRDMHRRIVRARDPPAHRPPRRCNRE